MNRRHAAAITIATLLPLTGAAQTEVTAPRSIDADLRQQIEEQNRRLAVLERKLELQQEAAAAGTASAPKVTASSARFQLASGDGENFVRLRGTLHADSRVFGGDSVPEFADTFLLRRVRPTVEGSFGGIYDFRFMPDFGGGRSIIVDAYAVARFHPSATLTVGKFKPSVGLERLQSSADIRFIERGLPTNLVPNRDIGLQLSGEFAGGVFSYQLGYFNGVTDGQSSDNLSSIDAGVNTGGDYAARVFVQPFLASENFSLRGLGIGIGATWQDLDGAATNTFLSSYRSPGQQPVFTYRVNTATGTTPGNATFATGERLRLAPQLYYSRGRFGLLGEYTQVRQDVARNVSGSRRTDTLTHSAWQTQFSWFLSGEEEAFRGFTPGSTFRPGKEGAGAWELVARYQQLDIDDDAFTRGADSFANPATSISRETSRGIGLNWYPWNTVKLSLNYDFTEYQGGAATGNRADEHALFTRFAINY